jgi:hypothetical protein
MEFHELLGKLKDFMEGRFFMKSHPLFGRIKVDRDDEEIYGYIAKTSVMFSGKKVKVDVNIPPGDKEGLIEQKYCDTYEALLSNWDKIMPEVLQAVIKYQNERWDLSDPTHNIRQFPRFKTVDDVLRNIDPVSIEIETNPSQYNTDKDKRGRYAVLVFYAAWVNEDYGLLSVALVDEKVTLVTDQAISG